MATEPLPRVSFGIIVFNGEPFTRYCLRSLYPFAHEIIVVEGACPGAAAIATKDGHSTDGTLGTLYQFQAEEDPLHKVQIVTRDGFWSEKDEQSQAYAQRATGDYLWQVDIDEFYRHEDMTKVLCLLGKDPSISAVSFRQITFWGGFDYTCDGWYLMRGASEFDRLFRWGPGYRYVTHRASNHMGPTVHDPLGRDHRSLQWVSSAETERSGIRLYHYSLLFPAEVRSKAEYYRNAPHSHRHEIHQWMCDSFFSLRKPYRVHNVWEYPSWLERFDGQHPEQIDQMRKDIESGVSKVEMRSTEDVEKLLSTPWYSLGRSLLRWLEPIDRRFLTWPRARWSNLLARLRNARPRSGQQTRRPLT